MNLSLVPLLVVVWSCGFSRIEWLDDETFLPTRKEKPVDAQHYTVVGQITTRMLYPQLYIAQSVLTKLCRRKTCRHSSKRMPALYRKLCNFVASTIIARTITRTTFAIFGSSGIPIRSRFALTNCTGKEHSGGKWGKERLAIRCQWRKEVEVNSRKRVGRN